MAEPKTYKINEIFYSLQGEGLWAGTPAIFIRFSNCNLKCRVESSGFDCDTEFVSGTELTSKEIVQKILDLGAPDNTRLILTGGEPLLQLDKDLSDWLNHGFSNTPMAVETNGTFLAPFLPSHIWLSVSPKTAEHTLRISKADELRYVRVHGQALPEPSVPSGYYYISPGCGADGLYRKEDIQWCVNLVKTNTTGIPWRLSLQQHKLLGLR